MGNKDDHFPLINNEQHNNLVKPLQVYESYNMEIFNIFDNVKKRMNLINIRASYAVMFWVT